MKVWKRGEGVELFRGRYAARAGAQRKIRFSLQEENKVFILKTPTHIQVLASICRLHTGVEIEKGVTFKRERLKNMKMLPSSFIVFA